jgi:hypothetical protein
MFCITIINICIEDQYVFVSSFIDKTHIGEQHKIPHATQGNPYVRSQVPTGSDMKPITCDSVLRVPGYRIFQKAAADAYGATEE